MKFFLRRNSNNVKAVVSKIPTPDPPKNIFEKKQGLIQFGLVVLTFMTLVAFVYFSNKGLTQAKDQLTLAQKQFNESLSQRDIDKKDALKNESIQDERFKIQNKINQKTLQAIELQAKIAKNQYESQDLINKEVAYQNRPIFVLAYVRLDTLKNLALITIKNVGKRPAKIVLSKVALLNISQKIINRNITPPENSDLNEVIEATYFLETTPTIHKDPKTMYYLHFIYQDLATKQTQDFEKYFHWESLQPNTFVWQDLNPADKAIFNQVAKEIKFDLSLKIDTI